MVISCSTAGRTIVVRACSKVFSTIFLHGAHCHIQLRSVTLCLFLNQDLKLCYLPAHSLNTDPTCCQRLNYNHMALYKFDYYYILLSLLLLMMLLLILLLQYFIINKLLRPIGPLQLDLVKDWTAETHRPSLQPGIQRPHTRPVLSTGLSHTATA